MGTGPGHPLHDPARHDLDRARHGPNKRAKLGWRFVAHGPDSVRPISVWTGMASVLTRSL